MASKVLGLRDARCYGVPGQAQSGLDVIAYTVEGNAHALQGKDVVSFDKTALKKAVLKFVKGRRPFDCKWLAIAVACGVERTEVLEELHRLRRQHPNFTFELWGEQQLSDMLRNHPHIVHQFFGPHWGRIFCEPAPESTSTTHPHRSQRLHALRNESRARLITRWLAAGLEEEEAEKFADDPTIGCPAHVHTALPMVGLSCIEGDFGSGKSVFGERIHQLDVANALNDIGAPIPVHLTARELNTHLKAAIISASEPLGDPQLLGTRVVLDGVDEAGLEAASYLLEQARFLVRSWPRTRIIVTARPGINSREKKERFAMPLLTVAESDALLVRLTGNAHVAYKWSLLIRETIRRPLFLLIAASLHRDSFQHPFPHSRAFFLESLVRKALGRSARPATEARVGLLRLATLTLCLGGAVPAGEVGTEELQEALLSTRLVTRRGRTMAFTLPVIEQYFGSLAILEDSIQIESIMESPESLERWRYALVLAANLGSWEKISTLLERLATHHPGTAIWVVTEAVAEHPIKNDEELPPLPASIECARRLRRGLSAWLAGFEPVDRLLRLTRADGTPHTVAAYSQNTSLTTGIWREETPPFNSDTLELPAAARSINSDLDRRWSLITWRSRVNSTETAWPWLWSLQWIATEVECLIKEKALPTLPNSPVRAEFRWAVAKWLLNQRRDIFHKPLPAKKVIEEGKNLLERLSREPEDTRLYVNNISFNIKTLKQTVFELASGMGSSSDGFFHRPWVEPDCPIPQDKWLSGLYSDETLRRLVEQVYQAALDVYIEMVNSWFPKLKDTLDLAAALPFRIEGMLETRRDKHAEARPLLTYRLCPLQPGELPSAVVTIASNDEVLEKHKKNMGESRKQAIRSQWHPASSSGMRESMWQSWFQTKLFVFRETPATVLAYQWLWRDLHKLRLVRSTPPIGED
ncbi:hypothetical protein F0U61_47425 [Archangium violaceum]|uniref:hypothetical protein n=1 Tax=Archangium violaceum TaxID=83451 RepID=UPI002B2FCEDD|nr:hypothetical protein F0U61_47425 [Archangium violaceum]